MSNESEQTQQKYDRLKLETKLGYTRVIDILEVVINEQFTHYGKTQVLKTVQYLCKQAIADIDKQPYDLPF